MVGYHAVGMKPLLIPEPAMLTSKTARQLLSAFAIKSVLSSPLSATLLVVEPEGEAGYKS